MVATGWLLKWCIWTGKVQARITKNLVDKIRPDERDTWVWDTEVKGFGLRVLPSGRKSYVVEYRPGDGGRSAPKRRYTIGRHGSPWTPDGARKKAIEILGDVIRGNDPSLERQEARKPDQETVEHVVAAFIERYAKKHQRSWHETQRVLEREFVPHLRSKPLKDISRRDIALCIDKVADRAPVMANRTFSYVRRFFNWCVEQGYLDVSPCAGLKPPAATQQRERVLDDRELANVWMGCEALPFLWSVIFKVLILTAQRKNEAIGMEWSEVDLEERIWRIPGKRTKNGRAHEVPLTPFVSRLLADVPRISGSRYLFSSTGKSPLAGQSRVKRDLDRAIENLRQSSDPSSEAGAPMPHWTIHDLRRTATTGMARLGIEPHVADAVLNHKSGAVSGVAAVYNRYGYLDERRAALKTWEEHVLIIALQE